MKGCDMNEKENGDEGMNENEFIEKKLGKSKVVDVSIDDIDYQEITFIWEKEQANGSLKVMDSVIKYFPNKQ